MGDYAKAGAAAFVLLLIMAAGYFFISGQHEVRVFVKDASGRPVDAMVFAATDADASTQKTAAGSASFKLPRKRASFRAASPGNGFGHAEAGGWQDSVEIRLGKSMLIVTSANRLKKKYGADADRIISAMGGLAETIRSTEGIEAKTALADYAAPVGDETLRSEIASLVREEQPSFLLIVGGHTIVPMHLVETPMKEAGKLFSVVAERDASILTDNPYGALSGDLLRPEIAVGRLPDGTDERGGSLLALLEGARKAHENKTRQAEGFRFLSQDTQKGYPTYYFETGSSGLVAPAAFSLLSADGGMRQESVDRLSSELSKPFGAAIITLHGNGPIEGQALSGRATEGAEDVIALLPEAASNFSVAGKLFLVDSCYGASPLRPDGGSIPVKLLENGAKGFVGSTMTAFSSKKADYTAGGEGAITQAGVSNAMLFYTYKHASEGFTAGESLALAKSHLDYAKPANRLSSLEFVLYGDPTAR